MNKKEAGEIFITYDFVAFEYFQYGWLPLSSFLKNDWAKRALKGPGEYGEYIVLPARILFTGWSSSASNDLIEQSSVQVERQRCR